MKKKYIILSVPVMLIIMLAIIVLYRNSIHGKAIARVTIKVVDEYGKTVENANASVTFRIASDWNGIRRKVFKGKTDSKGLFSASYMSLDKLFIGAEKSGYYRTSKQVDLENINKLVWKPWNSSVTLKLRKIKNPIPLYVKKELSLKIPTNDLFVGYDLFVGDWVEPHGIGEYADFIVCINHQKKDVMNYEWDLTIFTASKHDGFKYITDINTNSVFQFPYNAPKTGYNMTNLFYKINYVNGQSTSDSILPEFNHLFFRTRTEKDEAGQVIRCFYGRLIKLECSFISTTCEGRMRFIYYLNPIENDTNLEFNITTNMFPREYIYAP